MQNRQIVIRELPRDQLSVDHFELVEVDAATPNDGEVLTRTLLLSLDPANRAWMQGATYRSALEGGQVMAGFSISEVVDSRHPGFAVGDLVAADGGWQDHPVLPGDRISKVEPVEPLTHLLGALGITGQTAHVGMMSIGKPKPGETVVVSAAGGATGSVAGQIAKIQGARVVGIAGGAEKCARVVDEFGFDVCIDRRSDDFRKLLKEACPDGVDVYFDNVGGPILEAMLSRMNLFGRIVCCGVVSQYDTGSPAPGPRGVPGHLVTKRLTMQGFILMDDADLVAAADRDLREWVADGRVVAAEDLVHGLERAPEGLVGLLAGDNFGKRMVVVGERSTG